MATNQESTFQVAIIIFLAGAAVMLMAAYSRIFPFDRKAEVQASLSNAIKNGLPQVIHPIDLDRSFDFAGEELPMDNFDVRERLDRELIINSYHHSTTILNIKNAYKYFPVIEPILRENGVPDDFKYLAVAESDLQNATSYSGARGIWQFMKAMAEHYDLEVSRDVDERYHIEKATRAACEYLKDTRRRFGSWTLAAASYNLGGTSLAREMKAQRADNFYDLNLNEETSRYLFRLVAIKEIMSRPGDFGFHIEGGDKYPPLTDFNIVRVNKSIPNLGDFAKEHGISYRMLKVYNPWLRTSRLSNRTGKTYEIKIFTGNKRI